MNKHEEGLLELIHGIWRQIPLGESYYIAKEPLLRAEGRIISSPDIHIYSEGKHHFIEYKSNNEPHYSSLKEQLERAERFAKEYLGFSPWLWYAYGNNPEVELMKHGK